MNSQIKHNLFQPKTKSILQIENLVTFNNVRLMLHNPLDIRKHQNVPHFPYIFMFLGRGVPFIDYCSGVYGTSNLYSSGRCNTFFRGGGGGGTSVYSVSAIHSGRLPSFHRHQLKAIWLLNCYYEWWQFSCGIWKNQIHHFYSNHLICPHVL